VKRLITGLILAPAAVALILWAPAVLLRLVVTVVAVLSFYEYQRLADRHHIPIQGPLGYAAGLLLLFLPEVTPLLLTSFVLLALSLALWSRPLANALPRSSALVLGVLYIFGAWRCGLALYHASPLWLLFALGVTWVGDTAAYYAGRRFGRRKMAPEISPAKTWVGAAASLIASLAFGILYLHALFPTVGWSRAVMLSAAGNLAGQIGDLAESALKRGAGVKDSANFLPGHGGMLDRTDAALFAMPVLLALRSSLGVD